MRTCLLLLLAMLSGSAAPLSGAPVPKHLLKEGDNTEQGKLQGTWKLTSMRLGGMEVVGQGGLGIEMTIEIRGDKMTRNATQGGNVAPQGVTATIKLDIANGVKRFSTIDTRKSDGGGKPTAKEDDVSFGYALDGDKLTWAVQPEAKGKAAFADPAKPDANTVLLVFTRVKDEK